MWGGHSRSEQRALDPQHGSFPFDASSTVAPDEIDGIEARCASAKSAGIDGHGSPDGKGEISRLIFSARYGEILF